MSYKIHTGPVLDAYRSAEGCPLCALEKIVDDKQLSVYLGAAVMAPECRVEVNRHGFCSRHFERLRAGDNVLGVALQTKTRLEHLAENLPKPRDGKSAAKAARALSDADSHCVVCEAVRRTMSRYYETTAALFDREIGFEPILRSSKGHCMRHYAKLLSVATSAGSSAKRFIETLYDSQQRAFARLGADLDDFIDLFDSMKPLKHKTPGACSALERAIALLPSDGAE